MGGYRGEVGPSGDMVWTFRGSAHYQFHLAKKRTRFKASSISLPQDPRPKTRLELFLHYKDGGWREGGGRPFPQ